ncbi:hypothetical protein J2T13_004130 [Paenibacillus sp. DS2015]
MAILYGNTTATNILRTLVMECNLLVFYNGGWGGYGLPNPSSPIGQKNALRDHSRILEINPVTLEVEWQYTAAEEGFSIPTDSYKFYSPYISNRLVDK